MHESTKRKQKFSKDLLGGRAAHMDTERGFKKLLGYHPSPYPLFFPKIEKPEKCKLFGGVYAIHFCLSDGWLYHMYIYVYIWGEIDREREGERERETRRDIYIYIYVYMYTYIYI